MKWCPSMIASIEISTGSRCQHWALKADKCLLFRYDYIAVVDIDEVIMPLQHNNWSALIREIRRKTPEVSDNISTFVFRHALFLDEQENKEIKEVEDEKEEQEIPVWLHMLSHVNRSVRYLPPGHNVKSFHLTEKTQVK